MWIGELVATSNQDIMWLESDPWNPDTINQLVAWRQNYLGLVLEKKHLNQRSWIRILLPTGQTGWCYESHFGPIDDRPACR